MPVFTQPIHEFNPHHEPKGSPVGGQFARSPGGGAIWQTPRADYAPQPPGVEGYDKEWDEYFRRDRAWEHAMKAAISMGQISPEDAGQLGRSYAGSKLRMEPESGSEWRALPDTLYHVTTGFESVLRHGLRTRAEIGGVHRGLGGGPDDSISFTADLKTARAIRTAMLEARRVATGEIDAAQLLAMAKAQPVRTPETSFGKYMQSQGPRRAYDMLVGLYAGKTWVPGQPLPENLTNLVKGEIVERPGDSKDPLVQAAYASSSKRGLGMLPSRELPPHVRVEHEHQGRDEKFAQFIRRPMTRDERIEATFEMYKRYSTAREHGGGRIDPLFFLTDHKALARVPVRDIKIMQFRPRKGAMGYTASALGEWRTFTGRAVRYTGIAESA